MATLDQAVTVIDPADHLPARAARAAGKTTLGRWACKELGLEFLDLAEADLERLSRVVGDTATEVIELPCYRARTGRSCRPTQ